MEQPESLARIYYIPGRSAIARLSAVEGTAKELTENLSDWQRYLSSNTSTVDRTTVVVTVNNLYFSHLGPLTPPRRGALRRSGVSFPGKPSTEKMSVRGAAHKMDRDTARRMEAENAERMGARSYDKGLPRSPIKDATFMRWAEGLGHPLGSGLHLTDGWVVGWDARAALAHKPRRIPSPVMDAIEEAAKEEALYGDTVSLWAMHRRLPKGAPPAEVERVRSAIATWFNEASSSKLASIPPKGLHRLAFLVNTYSAISPASFVVRLAACVA